MHVHCSVCANILSLLAQSYVDMGIKLLQSGRWEDQYTLSLNLYEMSASLSYMCGDTAKMSSCLDEILDS